MNLRLSLRAIVTAACSVLILSAQGKTKEAEVEIKCLIPEARVAEVATRINLQSKRSIKRAVCFFDTDSLALFQHQPKLILRARYDSAGGADTTVKVRAGEVQGRDVECEFDEVLGKEKIMSCSLTNKDHEKAQIKMANRGRNIKKIFSKEQRAMLEGVLDRIDWGTLRPYGPVKGIEVWKKIQISAGPALTIERWELPPRSGKSRRILFEVSAKVPLAKEAETAKAISELIGFSENGDQESETKTRVVLEHFKSNQR